MEDEDFVVPQNSFAEAFAGYGHETSGKEGADTLPTHSAPAGLFTQSPGPGTRSPALSRIFMGISSASSFAGVPSARRTDQTVLFPTKSGNTKNLGPSPISYSRQMLRDGNDTVNLLKSRLYVKPENCDVLKRIKSSSKVSAKQQFLPRPPAIPSPPLNTSAYKTTMFRKDKLRGLERRRDLKVTENIDPDEPESKRSLVSTDLENLVSVPEKYIAMPDRQEIKEEFTAVKRDLYMGDHILQVIYKLRKRLGWPSEGIQFGEQPNEPETIDTMKKVLDDDGEFLYCLPEHHGKLKARYNPYNLKVVQAEVVKSCSEYYTVSASYVTQIRSNEPPSMTPVLDWLHERKMFYKIYEMPMFSKFRIWKGFTVWRHNIRATKNEESRGFGVGRDDEEISLLTLDVNYTYDLDTFCKLGQDQAEIAKRKLHSLRERIVGIVKHVCQEVITFEKERIEKDAEEAAKKDENRKLNLNPKGRMKSMQLTKAKYGIADKKEEKKETTKDKSKNPYKYTKLAQWRSVHHRLKSFIRYVDFLVMELLRRLVTTAVENLLVIMEASTNMNLQPKIGKSKIVDWEREKKNRTRPELDEKTKEIFEKESEIAPPLFRMNLVLTLPSRMSASTRIRSPVGEREDPKKHLKGVTFASSDQNEVEEWKESDRASETDDEDGATSLFSAGTGRSHSRSRISSSHSIKRPGVALSPNYQDFECSILNVIHGFELTVSSFQSLLKEPLLVEFITEPTAGYELSFDKEVMAISKEQEKPWPDTELLFSEDADYQRCIADIVQYLASEVRNVDAYSRNFEVYCQMVEQARKVDVDKSMSQKEWNSDQFHAVLSQFTDQLSAMKEMIAAKRHGMMEVLSESFRDTCLPYPHRVVSSVNIHLPAIACRRHEALLKIIKSAELKLERPPVSVEEFVETLAFLSKMSNEIPLLEKEYNVVSRLFTIAINFQVEFQPEEWALYQTLSPSFQQLKATILYCEAKKDENIQKFMKDLEAIVSGLRKDLHNLKNKVRSPMLLDEDVSPPAAMENIKFLMEDVDSLGQRSRNYASYQERFGDALSTAFKKRTMTVEQSYYSTSDSATSGNAVQALQSELSEVERDLALRKLLWESVDEWVKLIEEWQLTTFESLNVEDLQKQVTRFVQTVFLMEKGLPPNPVVPRLKQRVMSFKQGMPVISSLRNPALRPRHWESIEETIGTKIVRDKHFTLGDLLKLKIFQHKDKIADISSQASNEATLEHMLQRVVEYWNHTDFHLIAHSGRDIAVISGADEILSSLDESQVTLGNIKGSRFSEPIRLQVEEWERKLNLFSRTFEEWMLVQRNWLYLETIFSAADIQRQLPNESKLFNMVDRNWRDIMRRVIDSPNALKSATAAGVLEILQACSSNLDKIHRSLELLARGSQGRLADLHKKDYLETKRLIFARFYFLSNEELLDILANTKNLNAVQPHLKKCFGNVKALRFQREVRAPPNVVTMVSEEEEQLHLAKAVRARGQVEQWLGNVENTMFDTVKLYLKKAIADYSKEGYIEWVLSHPGQVIITVTQIVFNQRVVASLSHIGRTENLTMLKLDIISMLNGLASTSTSSLLQHKYQTIVALIIILVHARDVVANLLSTGVASAEDFEWTRQLRYDWDDEGNTCRVLHSLASFVYGYEYLGCSSRLVITPLTDRCYLTLTGALHLHLGGAPAGPAGTGKTETVKDLAKAMGKQCLVFNCSEGLDFKMIGKFLSGLAQSGSWCCFDEFNRIDIEVLSVVAQQLHSIKVAKDSGSVRFYFEARDIKLNSSCGVFITMNPGYAGRVELPDNLKSLFRPVAMVVPDYSLIAEIMLFSEGFTTAAILSRKLVNIYQLASKQLSQQDHYDFGLRAIKAVLVMAGQQKRTISYRGTHNEEEEASILINSIKNANVPKFIAEDVSLFERILADIFPGLNVSEPDRTALETIHAGIRNPITLSSNWTINDMNYVQ